MEIFTEYDLKCYLRNASRGKVEFVGSLTYLSQWKPELRGILQNCFRVRKVLTCHFNSQGRRKKSQLWEKKVKKPKKSNQNMFLGSPRKIVYVVIITSVVKLCWEDGEGRWVW